jgi:sigma-E factor negative regulatory protein RseB
MRYGLLLTAVATVTVPGLLAVLGVVGHDHQEAGAAEVAVGTSLGAVALSGPFPVAPPTARAGVRNEVAGVQRASGVTVTVLGQQTAGQQAKGMRLLVQAADAGQSTSYRGTELIAQSGVGGSVRETSQVWHEAGGDTLVQTSGGGMPAADPAQAGAGSTSPEGVFGVTRSLVALLGRHYVAEYGGTGSAAGRPASVVELYRFDGSLAARYWLDKQTMLPLRRELLAGGSQVISEDSFTQVQLGAAAGAAAPSAGSAVLTAPFSGSGWAAAAPSALTAQGWRVPHTLPGGLPLYAAAQTSTASGQVVDLEYSDGLYTVSLFVERGDLAASLPGWRPVTVGGQRAFASGHSVTWSGLGLVYTAIADAPPQTVSQVMGALPDSGQPGLLDRVARGLGRLAGMVNPFN